MVGRGMTARGSVEAERREHEEDASADGPTRPAAVRQSGEGMISQPPVPRQAKRVSALYGPIIPLMKVRMLLFETCVYTPNFSGNAQPLPKLVMPVKTSKLEPLVNGPPESP